MPTREKTPLDRAVEEHRAEQGPEQPSLPILAADAAGENAGAAVAKRGPGRPFGSVNLRAERRAELLRLELAREPGQERNQGDPLRAASRIAVIDITDPGQLAHYAALWGCSVFEVVKIVAVFNRDVMPYHHQQLPKAVVLNPGAPGGDRVGVELDGEFYDVTPEPEEVG